MIYYLITIGLHFETTRSVTVLTGTMMHVLQFVVLPRRKNFSPVNTSPLIIKTVIYTQFH